jgi:hypothetical protein
MDLQVMRKDKMKPIPVIDLSVGPSGLGKAFLFQEDKNGKIVFYILLNY